MVMQYLVWKVIAGLNEIVELSFLLVGHTKFALVDTIMNIARIVEELLTSGKNKAH